MLLHPERVAVKREESDSFTSLASLVPLILILMTVTGAVYPAIDLTAGERERGTLEILVAAPVPRFALLTAKYLAVVTVAVLTAVVNLVSMTITLEISGLGKQLFGGGGLTPLAIVELFGLLLLFAAFFSAVLLSLTSFARSFKEAQAYLIPLMLGALGPGVLAMMPGLRLRADLAVLPLVNIVLFARDLFNGEADPLMAMVVVTTTLLYALAALALARASSAPKASSIASRAAGPTCSAGPRNRNRRRASRRPCGVSPSPCRSISWSRACCGRARMTRRKYHPRSWQ